jgi:hypothetical protein
MLRSSVPSSKLRLTAPAGRSALKAAGVGPGKWIMGSLTALVHSGTTLTVRSDTPVTQKRGVHQTRDAPREAFRRWYVRRIVHETPPGIMVTANLAIFAIGGVSGVRQSHRSGDEGSRFLSPVGGSSRSRPRHDSWPKGPVDISWLRRRANRAFEVFNHGSAPSRHARGAQPIRPVPRDIVTFAKTLRAICQRRGPTSALPAVTQTVF